jgi:hypothetical protein
VHQIWGASRTGVVTDPVWDRGTVQLNQMPARLRCRLPDFVIKSRMHLHIPILGA